jgi:hypothetical protein
MSKLFQIATLVLMGMMLFSMSPASAAVIPPHPVAQAPDADNCAAICGTLVTTTAADDLLPTRGPLGPLDPCGRKIGLHPVGLIQRSIDGAPPATPAPGRRAITCGGKAQLTDCEAPLGHLPNISEREVRSVDRHDRIKLIPICDRLNASLTQVQQNLAGHGNAESLLPAIAQNTVLTAALGHARYRADDVVGIAMGTDTVMLYVHKM